jgi:transketolase
VGVDTKSLDDLCINAIRALSIDAIQKANSGHPGLPLGAAPMAYTLWTKYLKHNPGNPHWFNRDRFILSAGHGSMLLYSLLHLTGYDLSLDDLKQFRQLHSKTPGHPENSITAGVEMATGPLAQGFGHSVGFALAEAWLRSTFNKPGHDIIDHYTYVICSDGDLMEGLSNESGSLAGHLHLGRLIVLYDDNEISLDGPTALSFTENVGARFEALGWHVQRVNGMDVAEVDTAIREARHVTDKPSLIACKTIIGFGSPNKAGSSASHGSALGAAEVKLTKEALGIPLEPDFYVAPDALAKYRTAVTHGADLEAKWNEAFTAYEAAYPELAKSLADAIAGKFPTEWVDQLPTFAQPISTRKAGNAVLNTISPFHDVLIGGNADLSESTFAVQKASGEFDWDDHTGRNFMFGVREHAMVAAINGMTLHGGVQAYGGTFFVFSDYCRPSIRLAALMHCPSILVFTHDSVGLGEDGPTHQPVEHLTSLRAMPNLNVFRPADGNETAAGWKVALQSKQTPTLLVLSRQDLPALSPATVSDHPAEKGAYVLSQASGTTPKVILIGTGSEVQLCVGAKEKLEAEGIPTAVVSMPSWFLFEKQSDEYKASVFPRGIKRVSVEAGATLAWPRYSEAQVGIDQFGLSAAAKLVFAELGLTVEHVADVAKKLVG